MTNILFIEGILPYALDVQATMQYLCNMIASLNDLKIVFLISNDDVEKTIYCNLIQYFSNNETLKNKLSFDKIEFDTWNIDELSNKISKAISTNKTKAFAILSNKTTSLVNNIYPNNTICCNVNDFSQKHIDQIKWIMSNFNHNTLDDNHIWFTSDTHFSHSNIIRYCNRPWTTTQDMDAALIEKWNSVVEKNDIVWHLGDFSFGGKENAERIFPQLNGKINLVMGNHDHYKIDWYYNLGFHRVYDKNVIIDDFIILSHVPLLFLNDNCPFFNCFGHVHDSPAYKTWSKTGCCVCVERHNYAPISLKMIKEKYMEISNN